MKIKTRQLLCNLGEVADTKTYPYAPIESKVIPDFNARCLAEYQLGKSLRTASSVIIPDALGISQISGVGIGERNTEGLVPFNACVHQKVQSKCLPYGFILNTPVTNPLRVGLWRYMRNSVSASRASYPTVVQSMVYLPAQVDFWTARARAWHSMQPRFEGAVSMLNFLFEMKDFKDVAKAIANHRHTLYNLSKSLEKRVTKWDKSGNPSAFGFDPTLPAANAILVNNFAIKPLIKDLADIVLQANLIVAEVQKQYLEDGLSYQKTHFSEVITHEEKITTPNYGNYPYYLREGLRWFTKFTAHLYYKYSYSMRSAYEAFMKYWGLSGSFEALWNAMPYSFLADYFVGIGKSLHAMERDPNVTLTQWSYGESYKTTLTVGRYLADSLPLRAAVINGKIVDFDESPLNFFNGWEGVLYTRQLTEPIRSMALPKVKLPSSSQQLNMLALARCFF